MLFKRYNPTSLSQIDAVEIVILKHIDPNHVNEYMRIAKDAPSRLVDQETAQKIANLWRQLPPGEQARCHIPPFGLRFYTDGKLQIQGSICWECNNIYIEKNGENLLYTFDGEHSLSQQLLNLLREYSNKHLS